MLQSWVIGLSLLSLPFWWGEATDLRIVDSTPLEALVEDRQMRNPMLAPDGSALAWNVNDGMCVYRFEADETTCSNWPEDARLNTDRYNLPTWSPDSRQIILHEDFLLRLNDSDIWTFDVESGTYTNLTDDGYEGGLVNPADDASVTVDIAPFFNPTSGELYFFRIDAGDGSFQLGEAQLTLMKISDGGEAEPVRAMRPDVPGPTSIYRPGVFSEDGNTLYVSVMPPDWNVNPASGVYALDLTDDSFTQVASIAEIQTALPEWVRDDFAPSSVQAAADGLIVWLENTGGDFEFGYFVPVLLNTDDGTATSLVDYSGITEVTTLLEARSEDAVSIFDRAYTGLVMPGGQSYWLMVTRPSEGMAAVFEVSLRPGSDAEPELLATFEYAPRPGLEVPPTLSEDGKLLMTDVLFTLEADEE